MVRYELIKQLKQNNNFTQLVANGIVPISVSTWFEIYEVFLKECETNKKSVAVQSTADYFNFSNSYIYKIIEFME